MKILIIKLGAAGDVLRTSGCIKPLSEKYPESELCWLVDEKNKFILKDNPDIIKIFTVKKSDSAETLYNKLKVFNFDLIINLEESLKTSKLATELKGKKLGFVYRDFKILPT
ncbi:MAG: hypothetical protein R6U97_10700, partial [Desulfosalsimonas sp.]